MATRVIFKMLYQFLSVGFLMSFFEGQFSTSNHFWNSSEYFLISIIELNFEAGNEALENIWSGLGAEYN